VGQDCILQPIFNRPAAAGHTVQRAPMQSARRIQSCPTWGFKPNWLVRPSFAGCIEEILPHALAALWFYVRFYAVNIWSSDCYIGVED
jgi:hypothetical protein